MHICRLLVGNAGCFTLLSVALIWASPASASKVACVGDSITYGYNLTNPSKESYPAVLQTLLGAQHTVQNFGSSGCTLLKKGDKPYWTDAQFSASDAFKPDVVVVMLGTNDAKPQNWSHEAEFAGDYASMIDHYRSLGALVYVAVPPPVVAPGAFQIDPAVLNTEIVPLVRQIAGTASAPLVDVYQALSGKASLFPDTVHPNADGAKLIAQTVADALQEHGFGGAAGTGGAPATGGVAGTGGRATSGGTRGSGGVPASGGTPGSGGVTSSGGAPGSGGLVATGGQLSTGGRSITVASGGNGSGGSTRGSAGASSASGGAQGSGGTKNTGGVQNTVSGTAQAGQFTAGTGAVLTGGSSGLGGTSSSSAGTSVSSNAAGGTASTSVATDPGTTISTGGNKPETQPLDSGCACRIHTRGHERSGVWQLALLALVFLARKRAVARH